ncbi:MAG: hypothetical protein HY694_01580, partial [Deltaproteobacteria bacterium]|nr:hypothetical protein [Deltaproteobacteria bacterium]
MKARSIVDFETFSERIPLMTLEELVFEKKRSGDPYALRLAKNRPPLVVFQLEYDTEAALYLAFDRPDLEHYAEALRRCWSLLGLGHGDKVAIFDYGTSPVSYLASSFFAPYLRRGAADLVGCLPVCNDGISNMSQRAVEILRFVRPRVFFLRNDCLRPFVAELEREAIRLSDYTQALVAAENEGVLSKADQDTYERMLGVPIYRLLRIDAAMFLAMDCPECRLLHSWQDLYFVETVTEAVEEAAGQGQNSLVITNWFAKACPTVRYLSQVKGSLE